VDSTQDQDLDGFDDADGLDEADRLDGADRLGEADALDGLGVLVGDWLDWGQASELLHLSVSKVRQLIREHQLAAAVPSAGAGQQIPAALIMDGQIVKGVPGLLTVLHDGGYDDREILAWLFTGDDSLPGRPIDALRENRGAEVKRRAQAMAL
jgi:hypothetical protein